MNIYIPGSGNPSAKLLILGEAPSFEEEQQLKPFVGSSGRELDKILREVGIDRSQCWLTNVCKYMVPANPKFGKKIPFDIRAKSVGINIDEELSNLRTELYQLPNLNCILALGGTAFWALTGIKPRSRKKKNDDDKSQQYGGISDYRGSIMYGMGKKFVATYHPAHLLHMGEEVSGYYQREIMKLDFKRAKAQSEFPEIRKPYRSLEIAKSSSQLNDFINRNSTKQHPAIDIEAGFNCIPICIGIAFTPSEAITVPLWHHNRVVEIPESDHAQMVISLARFLAKHDIIGQNFKYDEDKINRLGYIIRSLYSDTMLKAFAVHPELPKNLAFNTSIYTEEPFYKNEGMYEGSTEDLFIGCARDSAVTKEIDLALDAPLDKLNMRKYYENYIRHLHKLYLAVETTGFLVDENKRAELLQKYINWGENLAYERFHFAKKEINTNSHIQVKDFLFNIMKCPVRESTGEDQLTSLYNQVKNDNQRAAIDNVLTDRRVRKTMNTYLLAMPDFDGRMKTTYYLCLETGRTSTGQLDPPIRPDFEYKDDKNKLKHKSIGTAFQTLTKHGDIGQDVRSIYCADPGYVIVNIDSSQAEARVIFLLAEDYDALTLIDTCDYHALTASWFVGGSETLWSKKANGGRETPQRFLGKTLRHAGHLGASGRRAMLEVNTAIRKNKIPLEPINERYAGDALKVFHNKQPAIRKVFQAGVIKCIENNHRQLRASVPFGVDAEYGPVRTFFERYGDELFRQAFSYIPQRAVTDNTKNAMMRSRKIIPDLRIVVEAHDSFTCLIRHDEVKDIVPILRLEMERPISFKNCSLSRRDLVIPSEVEIGDNYMELSKWRG